MKSQIGLIRTFLFLSFFLLGIMVLAQNRNFDCRVLLHTISDFYEGKCKNGFAHGRGIARGMDSYEGRFKLGLPHGNGTYVWSNGNTYKGIWKQGKMDGVGIYYSKSNGESVKGVWEEGEFIREIKEPSYKVIRQRGIEKIVISEASGGNPGTIEIVFVRDGMKRYNMANLDVTGNSGSYQMLSNYLGYTGVEFPFEGKLGFSFHDRLGNGEYFGDVEFAINKRSAWKMQIHY
jgi:hypothetical protein